MNEMCQRGSFLLSMFHDWCIAKSCDVCQWRREVEALDTDEAKRLG